MDSEIVRRRMNMLVAHFAPTINYTADDISAAHLLPLNCSDSLNPVVRRRDNRMDFARQGSASQTQQNCSGSLNPVIRRRDNRINFARQGSASQAFFMRPGSTQQVSSEKSLQSSASSVNEWSCNSKPLKDGGPLFSRPEKMEPTLSNIEAILPPAYDCQLATLDPPNFARPNRHTINRSGQFYNSDKKINSSDSNGMKWSPRMDVVESGGTYVLTVEIPGVKVDQIRVEINGQNLIIMGERSTKSWRVTGICSNGSISRYHKEEILQGPYEVVWPLPYNVNKDNISAEFANGLLQINMPKL